MPWFRQPFTDAELIVIAREHADAQGWPWREPVSVTRSLFTAYVRTNANMRGGNVNVHISRRTGEVVGAGLVRR